MLSKISLVLSCLKIYFTSSLEYAKLAIKQEPDYIIALLS